MLSLILALLFAVPPDAPAVIPDDAPPVAANYSETPNSCQCGDICGCPQCDCPDCPHRVVKNLLTTSPPLVITVADRGCPPCERFKADALPRLDAAGWIEGRHYILRVVPFGTETVPTFAYRGTEFARGYSGWPEWRQSLVRVMGGGQGADRKPVSSPGVQDVRLRSAPGYHSHRCNSCGTVWSHNPNDPGHDHYRDHRCPACGRYQNVVYQGGRGAYNTPVIQRRAYRMYGGCVGGGCR